MRWAVWVMVALAALSGTAGRGLGQQRDGISQYSATSADELDAKAPRVLIVCSYERPTMSTRGQEDGIRAEIEAAFPMARMRSDYLTMVTTPREQITEEVKAAIGERMVAQYGRVNWDLIVTVDSLAFEVMTKYGHGLLAGRPVVFSGLYWDEARVRELGLNATGVYERIDMAGTLELIRRLRPGTERVLVVSQGSLIGTRLREEAQAQLAQLGGMPRVQMSEAKSLGELVREANGLGKAGAMVYLSFFDSEEKEDYWALKTEFSVPVFGGFAAYIRPHMVGGRVVDANRQGHAAGAMAARVLRGETARDIPSSVTGGMSTMVNAAAMQRWDIPMSRVPAGAEVLDPPASLADRYRPYLGWIVLATVVQGAIIAALLVQSVARRRTEKRLRETQDMYETAMRNSTEGVWDWDVRTDEVNWSGSLREQLGIPGTITTSRIGPTREWEKRVHPDDLEVVKRHLQSHLEHDTAYDVEYRLQVADGQYRWYRSRGKVERDARGTPLRMAGSLTDVHDRVHAVEKLKSSEARFRALFERNLEPTCIVDERARVLDLNPAARALMGHVVARLNSEGLGAWEGAAGSNGPRAAFKAYLSGLSRGSFSTIRERDQKVVEFEFSGAPIGGGQHMVILRDVTERRRAERELAARELRYRLATEHARIAAWSVDTRTMELEADGLLAELLTGDPSARIGSGIDEWFEPLHDEDRAGARAEFEACARGEKPTLELTVRVKRAGGEQRWLLVRAGCERVDDGSVVKVVGTAQDVTERQQSLLGLRQAQEQLSAITDSVPGLVYRSVQGPDNRQFVEYVSRGAKEIIGIEAGELIGTYMTPADLIDPADAAKLINVQSELSEPEGRRQVAFRLRTPDGATKWVRDISRYRRREDGAIVWDGVIVDQTEVREAAERLAASERRYRTIVETAEEGIWQVGADWRTTFVNARMAAMLGWTVEEMLGRRITDFMDEDGRRQSAAAMHRREQGIREQYEFRLIRRDGSEVWTLISANALMDESDGRFLGALAMLTDITERRRADEAVLRERRLFLGGPAVAWRWRNAPEWPVEYVSANVSSLGYEASDFTSGRVKFAEILHPGDLERVGREVGEHIRAHAHAFEQEYRVRTKDGRWRWVSDHTVIEYDRDGNVAGFAGYTLDTTERRESEQRLKASEERLRLMVQSTPVGVISWGTDFSVQEWNPAAERIFGYSAAEVLGQNGRMLVPASDRAYVDKVWEDLVANRGGLRGTNENVRKDGRVIHCEWYNTPLVDASGRVIGVASIVEDITERRESQNRQALLSQELEHRVKNNLATVLSLAEQTGRTARDYEEFRHSFSMRLHAMTTMHNELARSSWKGVRLRDLVRMTLETFDVGPTRRTRVTGEDVQLGPRASQSLAMSLFELVTNAAKYGSLSAEGGRVDVEWETLAATPDEPERLRIVWAESGGPAVMPPTRTGLGSSIIQGVLRHELHGEVSLEFPPEGVRCEIVIPMSRATESGDVAGILPESTKG